MFQVGSFAGRDDAVRFVQFCLMCLARGSRRGFAAARNLLPTVVGPGFGGVPGVGLLRCSVRICDLHGFVWRGAYALLLRPT